MIRHHTFTDHRMTISAQKCSESALRHGCDVSLVFNPSNIDKGFAEKNKEILSADRGAGYWLWKPYFMVEQLKAANPGDIVIYTDAGIEFVNDVDRLINEMTKPIMLFGNGWPHRDWCKADAICLDPSTPNQEQVQASCIIAIASDAALQVMENWLNLCQIPHAIDDSESVVPNIATFREHRHDQALLTNVALSNPRFVSWNRWPAQYKLRGQEKYRNRYPQMFHHHRKRNDEWK